MRVRICKTSIVRSVGHPRVVLDIAFNMLAIEVQSPTKYSRVSFDGTRITVDCAGGYLIYNVPARAQKERKA